MTNSSPQNPQPSETPAVSPEERRIRQNIRKRAIRDTEEEWIAKIIAFGTIGVILFGALGARKGNLSFLSQSGFLSSSSKTTETDANVNVDRDSQDFVSTGNLDSLNIAPSSVDTQSEEIPRSDVLSGSLTEDSLNQKSNSFSSLPLAAAIPSVTKAVIPKPEPEVVEPEPEVPEPEVVITEPEVTEPEPEVVETEPEVVAFSNVAKDHWAYPFLSKLGEEELLPNNTQGFQPDVPINRAEMASLISSAFKKNPEVKGNKQFPDVSASDRVIADINKAVSLGFMNGYSEGDFRPKQNIPRYQVLVALATGLKLEPSGDPNTILQKFSDREGLPEWSLNQVAAATEAGLAVNRPGFNLTSLNPNEPATRAEVAAMIYQSLANKEQLPEIESQYIVPKP